jgi:class 3 adenylate cyclase
VAEVDMTETRKLAAILAADVVGYSRLAGSDEDRTLARQRALRSDLIDPTVAVHSGRVVKRTGDGILIEFRSVVQAVRCAIEVQNGMVERNAGVPPVRRIEFRLSTRRTLVLTFRCQVGSRTSDAWFCDDGLEQAEVVRKLAPCVSRLDVRDLHLVVSAIASIG